MKRYCNVCKKDVNCIDTAKLERLDEFFCIVEVNSYCFHCSSVLFSEILTKELTN